MKNITIKRKKLKAFFVIAIIGISILYNSYSDYGGMGKDVSNHPMAEIARAEESQESSAERLINFTKTIILSGIKQIISNH